MPIDNIWWFDIKFAYVIHLIFRQLGPFHGLVALIVLTRPFITKFRQVMGFY